MGINRGPNLIKDNLVFGYDTGYGVADNSTATRFYPGESTTNLFTYPYLSNHTDTTNGTTSIVKEDFGGGKKGVRFTQASTSPILSFTTALPSTPVSGGTYTWSNYVHSTSTGSKLKSQVSVYVNGVRHWLTNTNTWSTSTVECNHVFKATVANEWHRVDNQITMPTGTLTSFSAGGFYRSTSNFTIKVANLQFEQKGHATPFTATSRSNTASLIDLKRTASIDVSNISFNSTGQPTFDGTNDYILTPFTRGTLGDELTMIAYYKYTGGSTRTYTPIFGGLESGTGTEFFIGKNSGNTNIGVQDGNYSGNFVQGSNAWDGNYHQIVYTYNNGTGKIYLDGVLKSTGTFTKCNTAEQITVGRESEGSGYWFLGDIARACAYSRELTADEIKQNFNAYKNRFNI
jgi:hypothetical protein